MEGWILRHQNLLPFSPESEYYHQKRNIHNTQQNWLMWPQFSHLILMRKWISSPLWSQIQVQFEPLSAMEGWNPWRQNLLPFCPESEYYHQKRNIHPQHITNMIDVITVSACDFNVKTSFFAIVISDTSAIWTTFRYDRVKSEASKFIAILSCIRILPSKAQHSPTTLNKIDWCDHTFRIWFYYENEFLRHFDFRYKCYLNHFAVWQGEIRGIKNFCLSPESEYSHGKRVFDQYNTHWKYLLRPQYTAEECHLPSVRISN